MPVNLDIFWAITVALSVSSLVVLYFTYQIQVLQSYRNFTSYIILTLIIVAPYGFYKKFGNSNALVTIYTNDFQEKLHKQSSYRKIYTDIQKELVKNKLLLAFDRDNVEYWWKLGKMYEVLQDYPKAKEAFENAARLEPNNPSLQVNLYGVDALYQYNQQQYAGAIKSWQQILKFLPNDQIGQQARHDILAMIKKAEKNLIS